MHAAERATVLTVEDRAGVGRSALGRASPARTTALAVLLRNSASRSRRRDGGNARAGRDGGTTVRGRAGWVRGARGTGGGRASGRGAAGDDGRDGRGLERGVPGRGRRPGGRGDGGRGDAVRARSGNFDARQKCTLGNGSVLLTVVGVELLVDVNEDTGVGRAVGTGEVDGRGLSRSRTADVDLEAGHVELGATNGARDVESLKAYQQEVCGAS